MCVFYTASQEEKLKKLRDDFGEWRLKRAPEYATSLGINKYNDIVEDMRQARFQEDKVKTQKLLNELMQINYEALNEVHKVDYDIFNDTLQTFINGYKWQNFSTLNAINFLEGPQTDPGRLADQAPFTTYGDYINYLARLQRIPQQIDEIINRLKLAVQLNHTYHNVSMDPVPEQISKILSSRPEESAYYEPYNSTLENNVNLKRTQKDNLRRDAKNAIKSIMGKFTELKSYIEKTYSNHYRASPGVSSWDRSGNLYRDCLRWHLSLDMSPEEVHNKGLAEVDRISNLMQKIMTKLKFNGSVKEFFDSLKQQSKFFLNTSEEVLNKFKEIVHQKIEPKLPKLFKDLPNLPVVVAPTPTDGPGGMYIAGPADGSRPGTFLLNLFRPQKMITIDFMALSLHETNPGHHLQISTASTSKLTSRSNMDGYLFTVPLEFPFYTAYVEGWALYAESLGEELHLYETDYDLMGRYASQIFRACRLVVDTGLHHYNWSREKAIQYMLNYTAYNEEEITIEINRYCTWPGQACAYKIGELKIRELRTRAEQQLGTHFDIKEFHSTVLKNGVMPLNALERRVNKWITDTKANAGKTAFTADCTGTSAAYQGTINLVILLIGIVVNVHTIHSM